MHYFKFPVVQIVLTNIMMVVFVLWYGNSVYDLFAYLMLEIGILFLMLNLAFLIYSSVNWYLKLCLSGMFLSLGGLALIAGLAALTETIIPNHGSDLTALAYIVGVPVLFIIFEYWFILTDNRIVKKYFDSFGHVAGAVVVLYGALMLLTTAIWGAVSAIAFSYYLGLAAVFLIKTAVQLLALRFIYKRLPMART